MMCVPYHSRALGFLSRILSAETDVPSLSLCHTVGSLSMSCLITLSSLSGPFLLHFSVFTPTLSPTSVSTSSTWCRCFMDQNNASQLLSHFTHTKKLGEHFFFIFFVFNHLWCLHFLRGVYEPFGVLCYATQYEKKFFFFKKKFFVGCG